MSSYSWTASSCNWRIYDSYSGAVRPAWRTHQCRHKHHLFLCNLFCKRIQNHLDYLYMLHLHGKYDSHPYTHQCRHSFQLPCQCIRHDRAKVPRIDPQLLQSQAPFQQSSPLGLSFSVKLAPFLGFHNNSRDIQVSSILA